MTKTSSFLLSLLQIFPPAIGALFGSLFSVLFFLFLHFAIQGAANPESFTVVSNFLLFGVIFVSALSSNILAPVFWSFYARETFHRKFREVITQIFFCNLGLLFLVSPIFLLISLSSAYSFAVFLLPFLAISSALLYNIFIHISNPVLAAYKAILAAIFVALATFLISPAFLPQQMMPFFFLPVAWALIPLASLFTEKITLLFEFYDFSRSTRG